MHRTASGCKVIGTGRSGTLTFDDSVRSTAPARQSTTSRAKRELALTRPRARIRRSAGRGGQIVPANVLFDSRAAHCCAPSSADPCGRSSLETSATPSAAGGYHGFAGPAFDLYDPPARLKGGGREFHARSECLRLRLRCALGGARLRVAAQPFALGPRSGAEPMSGADENAAASPIEARPRAGAHRALLAIAPCDRRQWRAFHLHRHLQLHRRAWRGGDRRSGSRPARRPISPRCSTRCAARR